MRLSVRLFAAAREAAQADLIAIDVADDATAAEVLGAVEARGPAALAAVARRSRLAVNEALARGADPVRAGDALALIPPVGGG